MPDEMSAVTPAAHNPHRIELGDFYEGWRGQWVEIKPWMSFAAAGQIEASRFEAPVEATAEGLQNAMAGGEMRIGFAPTPVKYAATLLGLQVLRWNVLGYDGEPLPVGRPGVMSDLAPIDVIDVIVAEADKFYAALRPNLPSAESD